jgi:hypothetical protein
LIPSVKADFGKNSTRRRPEKIEMASPTRFELVLPT